MNAPNPPHWTLNSCFGALHSVWVHLGSFRNPMKLDAKQGEIVQLMRKFVPRSHAGIFLSNARIRPHWTLNSCFGLLYSVWVHLGSFRNCKKRDAKQGELVQLMQKFMPRSHVGIFRNERTQSTPLNPNSYFHKFHCVWVHLLWFCNCMKLGAKRAEVVQKFVPRSRAEIFAMNAPNPPHWTLS